MPTVPTVPSVPSVPAARRTSIIWDFVERAGWSAGQQFVSILLTAGSVTAVVGLPWELALWTAAGAAIVSMLTTAVLYLTSIGAPGVLTLGFWPDLMVRLVKTFLSSLLGSMGAAAVNPMTFGWVAALNVAAVATLGALAKGLLAREPLAAAEPTGSAGTVAGVKPDSPSTLRTATYLTATGRESVSLSG